MLLFCDLWTWLESYTIHLDNDYSESEFFGILVQSKLCCVDSSLSYIPLCFECWMLFWTNDKSTASVCNRHNPLSSSVSFMENCYLLSSDVFLFWPKFLNTLLQVFVDDYTLLSTFLCIHTDLHDTSHHKLPRVLLNEYRVVVGSMFFTV